MVLLPKALIICILCLGSIWQAMVVAGSAPPGGYRFELIHVDANGSFTKEEVIHRAVNRTRLRAAMLSAEEEDDGGKNNNAGFSGPFKIQVEYSPYTYVMELKMGTLPEAKPFLAVADTGSELVWTKEMKMCTGSPSFSTTNGSCVDECRAKGWECSTCMFNKTYSGGTMWMKGFTGKETLALAPATGTGTGTNKVGLVCAIEWSEEMLPPAAQGIVGLSRGPMSLVTQLGVTKFSYCLSDPREPTLRSPLWLGDVQPTGKDGWRSTPLVKISTKDTGLPESANSKYYVELEGICVQDQCREPLPREDFRWKSQHKGLMMVDSGTTYTHLDTKVFEVLKDLLFKVLHVHVVPKDDLNCFETPPSPTDHLPDLVLRFTGADMRLPWASYVSSALCLDIEVAKKSILGSIQQHNTYMLYDLAQEKLSFKRVPDCSKL